MLAAAAAVVRRGVTIMRVEFSRVAVFLNDGFPPAHADGRRLIERGPPDPGEDSMLQFRPRASTRVFSSRLLPPPTLGERRQRGLTRRLVAVRAAYPLCGGRRRWRLRRPRGRRLRWPRRQDGDAEGEGRSRRGHLRPLLPQSSSACASARACLGSCNHRSRGKGCGKQFVIMNPR